MKYRPDIDGLRALAVIAVVLFHSNIALFIGGFVGVDVFFVISGFLITSLLMSEREAGTFSLVAFYERRIRRLLPAATFVIIVSAACAWLFFLPAEFRKLSESLAAYTFFVSNWYFLNDVSYFAPAAEQKVLLHTWSLSVEEQFYLVFPFLILVLKDTKRSFYVLAILFVSSIYYAHYLWISRATDALFFNSFARFWELLAGCLAAFLYRRFRAGYFLSTLFRAVGVIAIGYAVFTFKAQFNFAPSYILIPVLGSVLLLVAPPNHHDPLRWVLASYPFRIIGQLSYSIYLWHWPIFVFARMYFGNLTPIYIAGCIILTLVFSILSLYLIENPIRHKRLLRARFKPYALAGLSTTMIAIFSMGAIYSGGFPNRLPKQAITINLAASDWESSHHKCFDPPGGGKMTATLVEMAQNDRLCLIGAGKKDAIDFVVWGDSHGFASLSAFSELATAHGLTGVVALHAGCPPLVNTHNGHAGKQQKCTEFYNAVATLVKRYDISYVFLVARWSMYVLGELPDGISRGNSGYLRFADNWDRETDTKVVFKVSVENTIKMLSDRHIIFVKEVPTHRVHVPNTLATNIMLGPLAAYREHRWTTRSEHKVRHTFIDSVFLEASIANPKVTIVDPIPRLCPENRCIVYGDGKPLYWDDDHINRSGARFIKPIFEPLFSEMSKRRGNSPTSQKSP